ncbi:protein bunched, class 2/F/G isoform-like isoform X3 [Tenebrio molitor]|uniref:protein bunched, class 2/F/G isoform-like isoform X3 n=1 Tax=Tenebrio molitor TaxID=7067 RepID=UPI003624A1E1
MSTKHKHEKKSNVINRTTSETLRLGESDLRILPQSASNSLQALPQGSRKKIQNSSSSFQITGVSMTRTDVGDDSADDLDTDDISRVTDNETPSFSEDSRDTDEHQLEPPTTVVPQEPPQAEVKRKPPDERFKIVKMPQTTPFIRGRWQCHDFFDDGTENGPRRLDPRPSLNVQVADTTPHLSTLKGYPQGFSSILASGLGPVHFADQENITLLNQKAANQPSNVNGQKDDILSDIKVALTSTPASNSGIGPKECQNAGVGSESIFRENRRSITSVTATCNFLLNLMMTEHREMVKSPLKGSDEDLPLILPGHDFNEATVFAVYCFIKKFVGSAPNNNNIDRKIEEALVSQFLVTPDKQKHITVI